jgi:uncharacterized protein (TIGR02284 family)
MKPETVEALQELMCALKDSVSYHQEAADKIEDKYVESELLAIASERAEICRKLSQYVAAGDENAINSGTWMGSLRTIWTAFRAGLNSGDATVVLIEAERAEDVIKNKFEIILPEIAGNPINDKLLLDYKTIKAGHDRVLAMRNALQNA